MRREESVSARHEETKQIPEKVNETRYGVQLSGGKAIINPRARKKQAVAASSAPSFRHRSQRHLAGG